MSSSMETVAADRASARVELPSIRPSTAWIYGSLGFPIAMLGYPLGAYIPRPVLTTEMGISLTAIGLVIMVAAIFDAITDPLMGHFSDRWRTRWGAAAAVDGPRPAALAGCGVDAPESLGWRDGGIPGPFSTWPCAPAQRCSGCRMPPGDSSCRASTTPAR